MNTENLSEAAWATFAAGCFWGVEALFARQNGVIHTSVGYMGGSTEQPTYDDVCTGTTMHAEVVRVGFNPQKVDYEQLLRIFWHNHDPTTLNRQGLDIGTQYRSAVFYHTPQQQQLAMDYKQQLQDQLPNPIVTQIVPVSTYWLAEEYHQQYLAKRHAPPCSH